MNSYYASAERLGIDVLYEADVVDLHLVGGRFESLDVQVGGLSRRFAQQPSSSHPEDSRPIWTGCARSGATRQTTSSCAAHRTTQACR